MQYAGPRMLYRHPLLALRHRIDALQRALCLLAGRAEIDPAGNNLPHNS